MYTLKDYLSEALVKHKISYYRNDDNVVDFGLSVKWLKYNLAGDKLTEDESDYGYYYQWGSTVGYPDASKHEFTWETTPYCNGSHSSFSKYVVNRGSGTVDNKDVLDSEDDAVTALFGSEYRMPTIEEFQELCEHCTGSSDHHNIPTENLFGATSVSENGIYWVAAGATVDGVKYKNAGLLCVGQDIFKRIFFPAAGYGYESSLKRICICGHYWTSSLELKYSSSNAAYRFFFMKNDTKSDSSDARYYGCNIRGIKVK